MAERKKKWERERERERTYEVPGKKDKVTGVHEQGQVDVLVRDAAFKPGRLDLKQVEQPWLRSE
jgi:hypothetical protein